MAARYSPSPEHLADLVSLRVRGVGVAALDGGRETLKTRDFVGRWQVRVVGDIVDGPREGVVAGNVGPELFGQQP